MKLRDTGFEIRYMFKSDPILWVERELDEKYSTDFGLHGDEECVWFSAPWGGMNLIGSYA